MKLHLLAFVTPLAFAFGWKDSNVFNTIYDMRRYDKTGDLTNIPNGIVMATIPAGTPIYRLETGDISEIGHYWYCLDPAMCLSVGPVTQFGEYRLTQEVRMMALTGRSTFIQGVESYLYRGRFGPGDDGEFPKTFCEMNDLQNGSMRVHGYARFFQMWEIVLCRPWNYVKSIRNQTITHQGLDLPLTLSATLQRESRLRFDWTSMTLLQPEMQPQPSEKIFPWHQLPNFWEASPSQVKRFQESVRQAWEQAYVNKIKYVEERDAIDSLATTVGQIVLHFGPALNLVLHGDQEAMTVQDIRRTIGGMLWLFGRTNSTEEYQQSLQNCRAHFDRHHSIDSVAESRKVGFSKMVQAIQNVVAELCDTLMALTTDVNISKAAAIKTATNLTWRLHWSAFERCDKSCRRQDQCAIGNPIPTGPGKGIMNVCSVIKAPWAMRHVDGPALVMQ
jgi:hypothetical protein